MMPLIVVLVIVVLIMIVGTVMYNSLVRLNVQASEAWSDITVQLKRRADLIPNLVNTVKGYASHEKTVFEEVTAARAAVSSAAKGGSVDEKAQAQGRLDRAVVDVLAVAENYPDLKASTNFLQLQTELS